MPGTHTAGDSTEEAYRHGGGSGAHTTGGGSLPEAKKVPLPSRIEALKDLPEHAGRGWGLVEIDVMPYLGKTEKVNVTLPGSVIRKIDAYVSLHGIKSRSAFFGQCSD